MTRARKLRSGITDEEREGTEVINDVLQGVAIDASSDDDEDSVALESQQQASSSAHYRRPGQIATLGVEHRGIQWGHPY